MGRMVETVSYSQEAGKILFCLLEDGECLALELLGGTGVDYLLQLCDFAPNRTQLWFRVDVGIYGWHWDRLESRSLSTLIFLIRCALRPLPLLFVVPGLLHLSTGWFFVLFC